MEFRSNNIGILPVFSSENEPIDQTLCIVKYHPNRYFGEMENYISSGWKDCQEYLEFRGHRIPKETFLHKESHYALAFVCLNEGEESPRLESVEDRPAYIDESDYGDFFKAYQRANLHLVGASAGISFLEEEE